MNRQEFLDKLKEVGFDINVKFTSGTSDADLYLGIHRIDVPDYEKFGFFRGGTYNPVGESRQKEFNEEDFKRAVRVCNKILEAKIYNLETKIDYHFIRSYLQKDLTLKKKIEQQSFQRTLDYLHSKFQDLWKGKKLEVDNRREQLK